MKARCPVQGDIAAGQHHTLAKACTHKLPDALVHVATLTSGGGTGALMLQTHEEKNRYGTLPDARASGEKICGEPLRGMPVWILAEREFESQIGCNTDASQASAFDAPRGHAQTTKWQTFAGVPRVTYDDKCAFL